MPSDLGQGFEDWVKTYDWGKRPLDLVKDCHAAFDAGAASRQAELNDWRQPNMLTEVEYRERTAKLRAEIESCKLEIQQHWDETVKLRAIAEAARAYFMGNSVGIPMQPRERTLLDALAALDVKSQP